MENWLIRICKNNSKLFLRKDIYFFDLLVVTLNFFFFMPRKLDNHTLYFVKKKIWSKLGIWSTTTLVLRPLFLPIEVLAIRILFGATIYVDHYWIQQIFGEGSLSIFFLLSLWFNYIFFNIFADFVAGCENN